MTEEDARYFYLKRKLLSLPENEIVKICLRHALCLIDAPVKVHPSLSMEFTPLKDVKYTFDNWERDGVDSFIENGKGWIKFDLAGSLMLLFDKVPIDPTNAKKGNGTLYRHLYSQEIPWDSISDFMYGNCIRSPEGLPAGVVRHLLENVDNCGWEDGNAHAN